MTMLWLFLVLSFQFRDTDRWVFVPLSFYGPWTCLDCTGRAEMDTPAADLAMVFPDRPSLHEMNIIRRADLYTGPAGSAGTCDGKFSCFRTGMGSKPWIRHVMEKFTKDRPGKVPVFTAFDDGNDLRDVAIG